MKSEDLVVGRQIVYTAPGTDKQEFGFVTSWHDETAFCRFWNKHDNTSLRTIANSESCYIQDLQVYAAVPQEFVIKMCSPRIGTKQDIYFTGFSIAAVVNNLFGCEAVSLAQVMSLTPQPL